MASPFTTYLKSVSVDFRMGNATEYTYRSALETYMESVRKGVKASSDPKHIKCGAPDFIIEKRRVPLGYVETKDIGDDLNKTIKTPQLKRYLKALNNLILTDYLEFRWYLNGQLKRTVRIAEIDNHRRLVPGEQAETNLENLFEDFYATVAPTVTTPKELAMRLAGVSQFIKEQIVSAFTSTDPSVKTGLEQRLKAFQTQLLPTLTPSEFADLYAQTMTYGLFASKLAAQDNAPTEEFTLRSAYQFLGSNKFLRHLFLDVSEELDDVEIIRPYLEDIVSLLNRARFDEILADFGQRTRTSDPVVHFYETFLAEYDPKLRESRGVYYTPEPVVQFIVRSIHNLLKTEFNKPWGLADQTVKVLDPATGTGTFLYFIIQQVHEEVVESRHQAGQWPQVSKNLLRRLFGFELLMAPYVISHLKLGLELKTLGVPLEGKDERLGVYLTDTLEEGVSREDVLGFGNYIAEESNEATKVKRDNQIMVVLGNPPYSYDSSNNGKWISNLIKGYYQVDGKPLGEANPKGLQDDYVKFIRYGEWRIEQSGYGILGYITNHGYLENLTFRGMRQHLLDTFDYIYLIDLHGNSKRKETRPDGGIDKNVFDIEQGVAIILAIKHPRHKTSPESKIKAEVFHMDVWGPREEKYAFLMNNTVESADLSELKPKSPDYLFVPYDSNLEEEYDQFWNIKDVFVTNSLGLFTARDDFTIQFSAQESITTTKTFVALQEEEARSRFNLGQDSMEWKVKLAQEDLRKTCLNIENVREIDYRPFDQRHTFYTGRSRGFHCRPRNEVMQHMTRPNIAMVTLRRTRVQGIWNNVFTATNIIDKSYVSSLDNANVFPLYKYQKADDKFPTLFENLEKKREPNLSRQFIDKISSKLNLSWINDGCGNQSDTIGPEDVFNYIYAVFCSHSYRTRYSEFLKRDYPRIPIPSDKKTFFQLTKLGKQLIDLQSLKSSLVESFITSFPIKGTSIVEMMPEYVVDKENPGQGRVKINDTQYFGGVPKEVWEYQIGRYQVCYKWIKDRKGRSLSSEDINHYQRIIVALSESIRLMAEIDNVIPNWPIE